MDKSIVFTAGIMLAATVDAGVMKFTEDLPGPQNLVAQTEINIKYTPLTNTWEGYEFNPLIFYPDGYQSVIVNGGVLEYFADGNNIELIFESGKKAIFDQPIPKLTFGEDYTVTGIYDNYLPFTWETVWVPAPGMFGLTLIGLGILYGSLKRQR